MGDYQGIKTAKCFIEWCIAKGERRIEEIGYKVYVTDTLKCIAFNTAYCAAALKCDNAQTMSIRYYDTLNIEPQKPEDTRTPEEIIDRVNQALARVRGEGT